MSHRLRQSPNDRHGGNHFRVDGIGRGDTQYVVSSGTPVCAESITAERVVQVSRARSDPWMCLPMAVAASVMTYLALRDWTRLGQVSQLFLRTVETSAASPSSMALTTRWQRLTEGFSCSRWNVAAQNWSILSQSRTLPDGALKLSPRHLTLGGDFTTTMSQERLRTASLWHSSLRSLTLVTDHTAPPYPLLSLSRMERLISLRLLCAREPPYGENGISALVNSGARPLPALPVLPHLEVFEAHIVCVQSELDVLATAFPSLTAVCTLLGRSPRVVDWTRLSSLTTVEYADEAFRQPTPLPPGIERLRMSVGRHAQSVLPVLAGLQRYSRLRELDLYAYTTTTFDPYALLCRIPSLRRLSISAAHLAPVAKTSKEASDVRTNEDGTVSPLERLEFLGTVDDSTVARLPHTQLPRLQALRVHVAECDARPLHVPMSVALDLAIRRGFPPTCVP